MKQEFVTVYGKAILEKGVLYFRSPHLPFSKSAFAQFGSYVVQLLLPVLWLLNAEKPMDYMVAGVFATTILIRLPDMADKFFRRSYASRLELSAIRSVEIKPDEHPLQTCVLLHLANNRCKKVYFRTLEQQAELFAETVSAACSDQLAAQMN